MEDTRLFKISCLSSTGPVFYSNWKSPSPLVYTFLGLRTLSHLNNFFDSDQIKLVSLSTDNPSTPVSSSVSGEILPGRI